MKLTIRQNQGLSFTESYGNPTLSAKPERSRKMLRGTLGGRHEFVSQNGHRVQIWMRDGKYLARARWQGGQIGKTLGTDGSSAELSLHRMLIEMDDGTFLPASDARQQRFSTAPIPKHSIRSLANAFLVDQRKVTGKKTAHTYGSRLEHVIRFAELSKSQKSWPLAASINRQFAVELKNFLFTQEVTRNGKDDGPRKRMSPKMVRLCLEAARTMFNWAARPEVRQLPPSFANPISNEIIGPKLSKDPLRKNPVPVGVRVRMVQNMDAWQLCNLAPLLIVPLRFEDLAGAKISDFDLDQRRWNLGTRVGGSDFNKGHVSFILPLPSELCAILQFMVVNRSDGPMFLSRRGATKRRTAKPMFDSHEEFESLCEAAIHRSSKDDVATEQDRKEVIRRLLRECGGVSVDEIGREVRALYDAAGVAPSIRPYDLRAATTTDLNNAGLRHLELRYLTGHSVNDILNEYTSLEPEAEIEKYFRSIEPLLKAIGDRASELGVVGNSF
jgi:integrase